MPREPWLHVWGSKDSLWTRTILDSLAAAGMKLRSLDANGAAGQGILCFSNAGDQLCQFLREVSRNGDERVLAVATSDAIAEDWQAWELLRAGASDVLVWSEKPARPERNKAGFEGWRPARAFIGSSTERDRFVGVS